MSCLSVSCRASSWAASDVPRVSAARRGNRAAGGQVAPSPVEEMICGEKNLKLTAVFFSLIIVSQIIPQGYALIPS